MKFSSYANRHYGNKCWDVAEDGHASVHHTVIARNKQPFTLTFTPRQSLRWPVNLTSDPGLSFSNSFTLLQQLLHTSLPALFLLFSGAFCLILHLHHELPHVQRPMQMHKFRLELFLHLLIRCSCQKNTDLFI